MILAVMVPHSAYKALVRKHDADRETDREGRFLLSSDRSSVKFIVKVLPAAAGIRTAGISIIRGQTTNIARQGFNRGLSPNMPLFVEFSVKATRGVPIRLAFDPIDCLRCQAL
jgi:hypothetical protein